MKVSVDAIDLSTHSMRFVSVIIIGQPTTLLHLRPALGLLPDGLGLFVVLRWIFPKSDHIKELKLKINIFEQLDQRRPFGLG